MSGDDMIERHHQNGRALSSAIYSDCGLYRYALTRRWSDGPGLLYVMLNPSTADERRNDPTVERCERRARLLGFTAFRVVNLFALRATRPADLKQAAEPVGPENDQILKESLYWADRVLCAWGVHGRYLHRDDAVAGLLHGAGADLWHLGLTKYGIPRHPLYVSYRQATNRWMPG